MAHTYELATTRILDWLHKAEHDLVGKAIVTFNGEAGDCRAVKLDDHHGLCFTIDEPPTLDAPAQRWYPVSTIRTKGR